ncbi:MAG: hypothetical protein HY941_04505 [Gammaproteobacteria bacterium]|nr:hypothetical protein [Gammaproteobacteria bacterium]
MNNNSNNHRIWVPLSGLLLIAASPVQATVIANSAVVYEEPDSSREVIYGPSGAVSVASYINAASNGMAAAGYGQAAYGALHASAFSAAIAGPRNETRGQGGATWIDQVTFSDAALTGTSAFARASFSLSGGLASYSPAVGVGVGNSTVAASVRINGGLVYSTSGQLVSWNGVITTDEIIRGQALNGVYQADPAASLTGTFSFDIPFVFGTAFQMSADLTAFTQAQYEASAYSNFGSSGYWGGISEVHLADGTILSGYSLSSASGFDWANAYPTSAVPIPATAWLFGSGLLGLIGIAQRKVERPA